MAAHHLLGIGETQSPWIASVANLALLTLLNMILIPWLGVAGAGLSFTVCYISLATWLLRRVQSQVEGVRLTSALAGWRSLTTVRPARDTAQ